MSIDLSGRRILFYGPGIKKEEPNINNYDCVIITNNQINLFFEKFKIINCDVVLLSNYLFSRNYYNEISKVSKFIHTVLVVNEESLEILKKTDNSIDIIVLKQIEKINKTPLGLNRFVEFLSDYEFEFLDIVGVDFYKNSQMDKSYESNYMINERSISESALDNVHDLVSNIDYFLDFYKKHEAKISLDNAVLSFINELSKANKTVKFKALNQIRNYIVKLYGKAN